MYPTLRVRLTAVLSVLILLALQQPALSQQVPDDSPKPAECFAVLSNDTVAFFFDRNYQLMPKACCAIVRYVRVNANFNYEGAFADYQAGSRRLLLRGSYTNQVRNGVFEEYYPENGQLHWRGAYQNGEPVGEWSYWYADGKPHQVLRYETNGLKFWQFWDETGQQLLVNGEGEWWTRSTGSWRGGPVRNGVPQGRWEDRSLLTVARPMFNKTPQIERRLLDKPSDLQKMYPAKPQATLADIREDIAREASGNKRSDKAQKPSSDVLSYELFEKGVMLKGILVVKPKGAISPYYRLSHLLPAQPYRPFLEAETLRLGYTCAKDSAMHALTSGYSALPPFWPQGNTKFVEALKENIKSRPEVWPPQVAQVILTLDIDKEGKAALAHVEPMVAHHTDVWLNSMQATWTPARRNDKPVGGHVIVRVTRLPSRSITADGTFQMDVQFTADQQ